MLAAAVRGIQQLLLPGVAAAVVARLLLEAAGPHQGLLVAADQGSLPVDNPLVAADRNLKNINLHFRIIWKYI